MEWTVITVLVALVGLLATVGAPVIKLNSNLTKLTVLLDTLKNDMQSYSCTFCCPTGSQLHGVAGHRPA